MYRIICQISGGHVVVREYLALRFLNDCSEFGNMHMEKQISKQEDHFQL
jgi:hypothetical protein